MRRYRWLAGVVVVVLALLILWWSMLGAPSAPQVSAPEPAPLAAAPAAPAAPVARRIPAVPPPAEDVPVPSVVPEARPEESPVYGRVRGAEQLPEEEVFVEGCGLRWTNRDVPVDEDGTFFASVKPGRCEMRAWRRKGQLRLPGPWVALDPQPGVEIDVELSVPTYEPAGMGIAFRGTEAGVVVLSVHEGSPAADAGLGEGDLVTFIDGVATAGMEDEQFIQHGVGKEGSPVELQGTSADGEAFRVVLRRKLIQ